MFFADIGGAGFNGQPLHVLRRKARERTRRSSATGSDIFGTLEPVYGDAGHESAASGSWTARASYGVGLETLPARLPDALRLVVEDAVQQGLGRRALRRQTGGSSAVPQVEVRFWIGYDF